MIKSQVLLFFCCFIPGVLMGQKGRFIPALPIEKTLKIMDRYISH